MEHALGLLSQLGEGGGEVRILAGGHSLLPMMKLRLATPEYLIDIDDLAAELGYVRADGSADGGPEIRIGAMTRHRQLLESPLLAARAPIFTDAERVIADPVVRNRGTIGGALCQADPSEDLSAVCAAVGARMVIRGLDGERVVEMDEFHRGPYRTCVADDEMLIEIRVPARARTGSAYEKVDRRAGDWAVVAAGASLTLDADGVVTDAGIGARGRRRRRQLPSRAGIAARRSTDRRDDRSRCRRSPPNRRPRRSPTSAARPSTSAMSPGCWSPARSRGRRHARPGAAA